MNPQLPQAEKDEKFDAIDQKYTTKLLLFKAEHSVLAQQLKELDGYKAAKEAKLKERAVAQTAQQTLGARNDRLAASTLKRKIELWAMLQKNIAQLETRLLVDFEERQMAYSKERQDLEQFFMEWGMTLLAPSPAAAAKYAEIAQLAPSLASALLPQPPFTIQAPVPAQPTAAAPRQQQGPDEIQLLGSKIDQAALQLDSAISALEQKWTNYLNTTQESLAKDATATAGVKKSGTSDFTIQLDQLHTAVNAKIADISSAAGQEADPQHSQNKALCDELRTAIAQDVGALQQKLSKLNELANRMEKPQNVVQIAQDVNPKLKGAFEKAPEVSSTAVAEASVGDALKVKQLGFLAAENLVAKKAPESAAGVGEQPVSFSTKGSSVSHSHSKNV